MATGQVLFQRFFYSKSFVQYQMETTAMSCVCLASKIEEAPRRIRDVMNVFHHIKQVRAQKPLTALPFDHQYISLKTQVIKAERRVLKELGFCVHVKHPHKLIVMYLQVLGLEKHQKVMQMAWNFMNDSLRTDVFVRYQPETIACACIYLTARKLALPLPASPPWFGIFGASEDAIIDVCYRVFQLYRRAKPNAERLEEAVDELKRKYQESRAKVKAADATPPPPVMQTQTHNDRSNGAAHNAWSGFISRVPPPQQQQQQTQQDGAATAAVATKNGAETVKDPESRKNSRSRSRSRSREDSEKREERGRRSRSRDRGHRSRKSSRDRSRSRSPRRSSKKKRRSRSLSSSPGYSKSRKG